LLLKDTKAQIDDENLDSFRAKKSPRKKMERMDTQQLNERDFEIVQNEKENDQVDDIMCEIKNYKDSQKNDFKMPEELFMN